MSEQTEQYVEENQVLRTLLRRALTALLSAPVTEEIVELFNDVPDNLVEDAMAEQKLAIAEQLMDDLSFA